MIEQGFGAYILLIMSVMTLMVASLMIPLFGFLHKKWKGLAWGCLAQPFVLALCLLMVIMLFFKLYRAEIRSQREEAMVTVKKVIDNGNVEIWHLKPDEECFYEHKDSENDNKDIRDFADFKLFDVLPLDSNGVCVDDKIFVHFDLKGRKVIASEFDEPLEVVNVDWNKVSEYFKNHR